MFKAVFVCAIAVSGALFLLGCSRGGAVNPSMAPQGAPGPSVTARRPQRDVTGVRQGAPALRDTSGEEWNPEDEKAGKGAEAGAGKPDLIKEAGFDMIYPNFNRETGRQDPFVPVSLSQGPLDVVKMMLPEKFRVIGTAMTPSGQIAMIQVGEQTKIVREDDVLENGSVVKTISKYDVVLEKDGRQIRLTMFTRKRIAKLPGEEQYPALPVDKNISDIYKKYLEDKYGEEVEGSEGDTERPGSFNEYMDYKKKSGGGMGGPGTGVNTGSPGAPGTGSNENAGGGN